MRLGWFQNQHFFGTSAGSVGKEKWMKNWMCILFINLVWDVTRLNWVNNMIVTGCSGWICWSFRWSCSLFHQGATGQVSFSDFWGFHFWSFRSSFLKARRLNPLTGSDCRLDWSDTNSSGACSTSWGNGKKLANLSFGASYIFLQNKEGALFVLPMWFPCLICLMYRNDIWKKLWDLRPVAATTTTIWYSNTLSRWA